MQASPRHARASRLPLPLIAVACYVIGAVWLALATYQNRTPSAAAQGRGGRIAAVAIASVLPVGRALAVDPLTIMRDT